jgi:ABC-type glycerol-3-phosphate transport system substrate-binding protein
MVGEMKGNRLFWIVFLIFLLFACRSSKEETSQATEANLPITEGIQTGSSNTVTDAAITIRMITYDWEQGFYHDLIEAFEADNPDIKIKLVSIEETLDLEPGTSRNWPDDATLRLASAADVLTTKGNPLIWDEWLVLDLQPLMEADSTFDADDYYPTLLEQYKRNGRTWGLPAYAILTLIFYNKDAFDQAGLDYPKAGWTWTDFLGIAQALTLREGEGVKQWGFVDPSSNPAYFIRPHSGQLVDQSTDPPTVNIDNPEVRQAIKWYTDLFLVHQVSPNLSKLEPNGNSNFSSGYDLIKEGRAAMWSGQLHLGQSFGDEINLGVVPFPVNSPNDHTSPISSESYTISAGTQYPEAAWRWIRFLSQQPLAESFDKSTIIPSRRSAAEASGF